MVGMFFYLLAFLLFYTLMDQYPYFFQLNSTTNAQSLVNEATVGRPKTVFSY